MADSPTQRTMRHLRQEGTICAVVEKWNQHVGPHGIRQDLWGIFDVLAIDAQRIVGIQCGGATGHAGHKAKILESDVAPEWLKAGGLIQIWSWRRVKRRLKDGSWSKSLRWQPRMEEITLEHYE